MSRAEDAVQRIYESADVRDELTDDEAETLLKWAEDELTRLDESGADDAAFDAKVVTLMDLLKQMNRYAGKQGQLSAQADDQTPTEIASLAGSLGHDTDAAKIAAAGTGDPTSTIAKLTELMGGRAVSESTETFTAESAEAEAKPQPAPSQPPPEPPLMHPVVTPQPPNAIKPHLPFSRPPSPPATDPAGDKSES